MKKRRIIGASLFLTLLLGGCSAVDGTTSAESDNSKEKIVVGTSGVSNPFSYEKDGTLTGYDIEIVREIFSELPEYELEFETTEFESILSGIDNDRYQLGVNNLSANEERKEKYTFSLPIISNPNVFVVRKDENDLNSLDDLGGYRAITEVGNSGATILENYNNEHVDDLVDITYTDANFVKQFEEIENGKYDVRIISKISAEIAIENQNFTNLKVVPFDDPNADAGAYILFSKTVDEELLTKVNERIKELVASNTLSKISIEQLGEDYSPNLDSLE